MNLLQSLREVSRSAPVEMRSTHAQVNELKIELVAIVDMRPAKMQPPSRGREFRVKQMAASLQKHGQLQPVIYNKRNGKLVVGHTRWLGAKELGWTHLNAIVIDMSEAEAQSLFVDEAQSSEKLKSDQWFESYLNGAPLNKLPKKSRTDIKSMCEFFGFELDCTKLQIVADMKGRPSDIKTIQEVYSVLWSRMNRPPSKREFGFWMLKHRQVPRLNSKGKRENLNVASLARAIDKDKPWK